MNILIAEDDEDVIEIYKFALRGEHKVEAVSNGEDCLTRVREACPDLLLLDVEMPRMDGVEVLENLRAAPETADLKVIVISGTSTAETLKKALTLKIDDFLLKPVEEAKLKRSIETLTFRPTLEDLKAIVEHLNYHDESMFNQPGLRNEDKQEFNLYPLTYKNLSLCVKVPNTIGTSQLVKMDGSELASTIEVFTRNIKWQAVLPKT